MYKSTKSSDKTTEDSPLTKEKIIQNRLAQYIDRVKNLEVENRQRFLKEADDRLAAQQEAHANDIQELREKYEIQMKTNREELEAVFDTKIQTLQNGSQRDQNALSDALKELNTTQNRVDDSNGKVVILEQINSSLHGRISDLQSALDNERSRSAKSQSEITRLRDEMDLQLREYQELMNAKNSLAVEIAAYNKLLSGAEQRLKLSSSNLIAGGKKRRSVDYNGNNNNNNKS